MIVLLLLSAVAVGGYWAGTQSRRYPHHLRSHPHAARARASDEISRKAATPVGARLWPWVLGMVLIAMLMMSFFDGPPGMLGGPGLFGGPGGNFAALFGP